MISQDGAALKVFFCILWKISSQMNFTKKTFLWSVLLNSLILVTSKIAMINKILAVAPHVNVFCYLEVFDDNPTSPPHSVQETTKGENCILCNECFLKRLFKLWNQFGNLIVDL